MHALRTIPRVLQRRTMSTSISITRLPSIDSSLSDDKSHHVGNPPKHFTNPWPSNRKFSLPTAFRYRFGNPPEKNFVPVPQGPNGTRSDELVKIRKPTWAADQTDRLRATWLGHASFFVETPAAPNTERGVRILFDPVFAERTSPVSFLGPKRYSPPPCQLSDVPDVDIVCISHNHYDHLDIEAVQQIYQRRKGRVHFLVGLKTRPWFVQNVGCTAEEVSELDWWDSCEIEVPSIGSVTFTCTPAQHGSARGIRDRDHALWCSWVMRASGGKKLYFAGDTGYQSTEAPTPCPSFKEIGRLLGPMDLALLPIGLMTPAVLMSSVHSTPEQSLQIHKEVQANVSIGMHYGTVRGGISEHFEDVRDPPRRWKQAAEAEGMWLGGGVAGDGSPVDVSRRGVGLCDIGETVAV